MYYYAKNNKKFGPVSIEELKTVGITKSTLIWTEGYPDWVEAEKITELEDVLKAIPPPLPKTYNSGKSIYPKDKGLFIIGLILFFLPGIFKITIDERDLFNILSKAFLISRLIIPFFTYSIAKKKEKNKLA